MLTVNNVTMRFGPRVLFENVTCTFMAGRRYAVTGPNGAGKSTFMKILTGELDSTHGSVTRPKRMGVLRQDQFAFDEYRVIDTVIMGNATLWKALVALRLADGDETGIALVANATQLLAQGKIPGQENATNDPTKTPFYTALEEFVTCIQQGKKPECGPLEGMQAAIVAIKANDAIRSGTKVTFQPEWFTLSG